MTNEEQIQELSHQARCLYEYVNQELGRTNNITYPGLDRKTVKQIKMANNKIMKLKGIL